MQTFMGAIATEFPDILAHEENDAEWGNEGRDLVKVGQLEAAMVKFKMLVRSQPDHHEGFEELALCYEKLGQIAEARYFMGEALQRARRFLEDSSLDQDVMDEMLANYARLDPVAYAQMSTEALVQAQTHSFRWPDPALLYAVIKRKVEAVPHLRQVLRDDDEGLWYSDFAAQVLATLYNNGVAAAAEAIPELVAFFENDIPAWLESLGDYLSVFGDQAIDPLLKVVHNDTLDWYQREMAASAAISAAGQSPALQARVAESLRSRLAKYIADDEADEGGEPNVRSLISNLAELRDEQTRELVKQAIAKKLIKGSILSEDSYEERIAKPSEAPAGFDQDWLVDYEQEYHVGVYDPEEDFFLDDDDDFEGENDSDSDMHLEEIDSFFNQLGIKRRITQGIEPSPIQSNPAPKLAPPPARRQPALGRNDLCWCGSGKKYKYCHLREDEEKAIR